MDKVAYHNMIINAATGVGTLATITVYVAGTENISTIYSTAGGAAKLNPFNTDANGRFNFYANQGKYDIQVSGLGLTTYKIENVSFVAISPYIDVREYASFSAAIDAIGADKATLLIPDQQNVTGDKTVPSNVALKILQGGSLNVSAGKTVTINGWLEAGLYQIFEGVGDVVLGPGAVKEVCPEWWGA